VDILVTHGPPHGTADVTRGRHVGDRKLLAAVQRLHTPPLLWVVGHIHASYRVYSLRHELSGRTIVVANVATNDLRQGWDTPPMVFDIGL
jgi:Icc-related predicted phosphoesterase